MQQDSVSSEPQDSLSSEPHGAIAPSEPGPSSTSSGPDATIHIHTEPNDDTDIRRGLKRRWTGEELTIFSKKFGSHMLNKTMASSDELAEAQGNYQGAPQRKSE
jgi:hypothetical protein